MNLVYALEKNDALKLLFLIQFLTFVNYTENVSKCRKSCHKRGFLVIVSSNI